MTPEQEDVNTKEHLLSVCQVLREENAALRKTIAEGCGDPSPAELKNRQLQIELARATANEESVMQDESHDRDQLALVVQQKDALSVANQKLREKGQALLDVIDERKEKRGIWEIPECELQCDALRKVIADTQKELDKMAYDQQLEDTERQIQELRQRIAQLKAQRQTLAEALRKAIADHRNASQSDTQAGKEPK